MFGILYTTPLALSFPPSLPPSFFLFRSSFVTVTLQKIRVCFFLAQNLTMASISSTPEKQEKKQTSFPPKRGGIKAQIFESLVKTFVSMVSRDGASSSSAAGENSASTTPPPSSYNSDS